MLSPMVNSNVISIETPEKPPPCRPCGEDYADYILVRRVPGHGDTYIPEFRVIIPERGLWWLPINEAESRADWEVVDPQPYSEGGS